MKILILDVVFNKFDGVSIPGGTEKVSFDLAKHLGADLYTASDLDEFEGIKIHKYTGPLQTVYERNTNFREVREYKYKDLCKILNEHKYDFIINNHVNSWNVKLNMFIMKTFNIRVISYCHFSFYNYIFPLFSVADSIIKFKHEADGRTLLVNEHILNQLNKMYEDKNKYFLSKLPIDGLENNIDFCQPFIWDKDLWSRYYKPNKKYKIGTMSRFAPDKNPSDYVLIFKAIREVDKNIEIESHWRVKETEQEKFEKFLNDIKDLNINIKVNLSQSESFSMLSDCSAYLQGNWLESFGISPLEFASFGVKVIVYEKPEKSAHACRYSLEDNAFYLDNRNMDIRGMLDWIKVRDEDKLVEFVKNKYSVDNFKKHIYDSLNKTTNILRNDNMEDIS